ncbi:PRD domain-containing protein [Companilactobacillus kimchii]|uniref:Transcription antiterminator n=2 Tax=Companilactobacillus kimchii TaxID=2801452 RepID=A0ABR5NR55_9LACO|nr:PRD domain-containing protein [Companilactobacillus kimchii]KAE9557446.1 hypothetical protein ATN91_04690 [Companilactobacillus kimchii]KRK50179.1 transcription antiterminator [Companilactobacillus kimchii DSM 13961 = JCM 10707]OWF32176.1 Levansucrase and sucrase synthesis operon antiterminator [Companilactobacillus kimchii]GEO48344.1 transcription antiterminator BglG [Companilactobacillus paralimentarius]
MKIKKILNNNAIFSEKDQHECIYIGAGLGFQKQVGDDVDEDKIEHVFVLQEKGVLSKLSNLIETVPIEYTKLTGHIVIHAEKVLNCRFTEMLYVSLLDHIYNLIQMNLKGIVIHNRMFFELKRLYPEEMKVSLWAVDLINLTLKKNINSEEAANIAMHLITSRMDSHVNIDDVITNTKKIHDILGLVRITNHVNFDVDSLSLDRFTIHLNFLMKRIELGERKLNDENNILVYIKDKYKDAYRSAKMIENYLETKLTDDELLYLTLHVERLLKEYKK